MSPVVHIVDDDLQVREMLASLISSIGLNTQAHSSAEQFYESFQQPMPGCVVVDVFMPGISGLSLQGKLASAGATIPVIVLTGHADVPMVVEALARGAFGFLQKPPRRHELLELVQRAVKWHCAYLEQSIRLSGQDEKFNLLTEREHEILAHVVDGKSSKEIAKLAGISLRTVEQHRANVMQKLDARSLAELVRLTVERDELTHGGRLREAWGAIPWPFLNTRAAARC
jgi:two-component system response regulator FixJ